jgi:hypothetical protein
VLYRGELLRGDVASILGLTPRHARRIVAALLALCFFGMSERPNRRLLVPTTK